MVGKEQTMFRLRVLPFFDSIHGFYVAQCLETGSITTASDRETALDMMDELLEDEISQALKFENLANLYSTPAPLEIHKRWVREAELYGTTTRPLNIKVEKVTLDDIQRVAEVEFARPA
jgi:hypothetical protein